MKRVPVSLNVNGTEQSEFFEAGSVLADALRDKLGLNATKVGCRQGSCGSCTVVIDGQISLSCLVPIERMEGRSVTTLEGIAADGAHPLQRSFARNFASQCGFCTPGMIMAGKVLLDANPDPSREDVIEAISGNICRCTGYEPIISAILDAGAELRAEAERANARAVA